MNVLTRVLDVVAHRGVRIRAIDGFALPTLPPGTAHAVDSTSLRPPARHRATTSTPTQHLATAIIRKCRTCDSPSGSWVATRSGNRGRRSETIELDIMPSLVGAFTGAVPD